MLKNASTVIIILLALAASSCKTMKEQAKPNVVIILTDDQAWGDLSVNGNTNFSTPNIDGMAEAGATFENFYVCPVCSPTRAELLTGRYNFRGGIYSTGGGGERLDLDETTIADVFKEAGYRTAAYGKWHNGMQYPYHPNARGFDDYYGFCSGHWGDYFSPMLEHNGEIVTGNGFLIDDFTDHGIAFMEKNRDKPFFLYLPFNTPHTPFQVPEEYWENFKDKPITQTSARGKEDVYDTRAALAMCKNIDWNVGRIIAKTEELGIDRNTIVLYFSDNGPARWRWNNNMKGRKGSTDEGGLLSPLIMKWPDGIRAGTNVQRLASVTDLLPTLTEMCGIEYQTNNPLDGISIKNAILNEEDHFEDRFILNYYKGRLSIRNQKYRLGNDEGLYDIENDRTQQNDLSNQLTEVKEEMMKVADSYRRQIEKELPPEDLRPFMLGHPGMKYTQIPARDAQEHGNIQRSNRYPNCSFFSNWTSLQDSITWAVDVPAGGEFKVWLYYTCPEGDEGSVFQLSVGKSTLEATIMEAHDPPLRGMEHDLTPRIESYVKDWKTVDIGTILLDPGNALMCMQAIEMPGNSVMDFRMLVFERISGD